MGGGCGCVEVRLRLGWGFDKNLILRYSKYRVSSKRVCNLVLVISQLPVGLGQKFWLIFKSPVNLDYKIHSFANFRLSYSKKE